jgi:hypothetical protein
VCLIVGALAMSGGLLAIGAARDAPALEIAGFAFAVAALLLREWLLAAGWVWFLTLAAIVGVAFVVEVIFQAL